MPLPKSFTKVTTFSKLLALSMFILIPILAFYYGMYYERQTNNTAQSKPILSISSHGGMCPKGECSGKSNIMTDGSVVDNKGKITKKLDMQKITELQNLINTTDFDQIKNDKFTGMCPTAYDGQESVYTFETTNGTEVLPSCKYNLKGYPLFDFIYKNLFN